MLFGRSSSLLLLLLAVCSSKARLARYWVTPEASSVESCVQCRRHNTSAQQLYLVVAVVVLPDALNKTTVKIQFKLLLWDQITGKVNFLTINEKTQPSVKCHKVSFVIKITIRHEMTFLAKNWTLVYNFRRWFWGVFKLRIQSIIIIDFESPF